MSRMSILLIASLLSWQVSAAVLPAGCEIILQTSFGRVLKLVAEYGLITRAELEEISQSEEPLDPWRYRDRDENTYSFKKAFARAAKHPAARAQWSAIRKTAELLLQSGQRDQAAIEIAKVATEKVLNPRLLRTMPYGLPNKANFKFNPANNELVIWNSNSKGGKIMSYDFTGSNPTTTPHGWWMTGMVQRNGQLWAAGIDELGTLRVSLWPKMDEYLEMRGLSEVAGIKLFEMPSGQILLALSHQKNGIEIFDISKKGDPISMLRKEGRSHAECVFHVTSAGEVFVALPFHEHTKVYKFENGRWKHRGKTDVTHNPMRSVTMATDAMGTLYLGEGVPEPGNYQVVKLVKGKTKADVIWMAYERLFPLDEYAQIHVNARNELVLAVAFARDRHVLNLINLNQQENPWIKISLGAELTSQPQWFTLPNQTEVLAVSPEREETLIIDGESGSSLGRVDARSGNDKPPAWTLLPDGRVLLAVESFMKEVRVYDMWRPDGGKP